LILIYVIVVLGGSYAEGYCVANDFDQAQGRVFQAAGRIIQVSPLLSDSAKITANRIEFISTGSTITAIASDYAGSAGANPTITIFDELWGYTSERSQRLWDEMVPVPTIHNLLLWRKSWLASYRKLGSRDCRRRTLPNCIAGEPQESLLSGFNS
jgi:hypothetical protein